MLLQQKKVLSFILAGILILAEAVLISLEEAVVFYRLSYVILLSIGLWFIWRRQNFTGIISAFTLFTLYFYTISILSGTESAAAFWQFIFTLPEKLDASLPEDLNLVFSILFFFVALLTYVIQLAFLILNYVLLPLFVGTYDHIVNLADSQKWPESPLILLSAFSGATIIVLIITEGLKQHRVKKKKIHHDNLNESSSTECSVITDSENLNRALEVRRRIFIDEQNVAEELEYDGLDENSTQIGVFHDGLMIGTGRIREIDEKTVKFERLCILPEFRGMGYGSSLLTYMIEVAQTRGASGLTLHAQTDSQKFYENHGFEPAGGTFTEAGISHIAMTRMLH